jgi:tRNA modification GTPase
VLDVTRPDEAEVVRPLIDRNTILVANKIDLVAGAGSGWVAELGPVPALPLSVTTGQGMTRLVDHLAQVVASNFGPGEAALITRARHRLALESCVGALEQFASAKLPELAAEELRSAAQSLGRITGRVDVEDMLDALFSEFCIGK